MQNLKTLDHSIDSNRNFIVVSIIVFTIILVGMLFCSCGNKHNIENYRYSEKIDTFVIKDKIYKEERYVSTLEGAKDICQFYAIAEKDGTIYKIPVKFSLYNKIGNNDKICIKTYSDSNKHSIFKAE